MAAFNKVIIVGNLTRDVEIRYTAQGVACANFSLAVNKRWRDESGQEREKVDFIDCAAYKGTAEVLGQYKKKGDPLMVEGELSQDTWDDKQTGQKRSKLKVVVRHAIFIDGGQRGDRDESPERGKRTASEQLKDARHAADGPEAPPADDDQVPF